MSLKPARFIRPLPLVALGLVALTFIVAPALAFADDDWLDILRKADISQADSAYDVRLYGSQTTLDWDDANNDGNFDIAESVIGSAIITSSAGTMISPANLSRDALELWAENHAEEIYHIIFPGGISQATGNTEDALMSHFSLSNQLSRVNPKAKNNMAANDSAFKAVTEYHSIETNKEDGDALSLILGFSQLFGKTEFGLLMPYRYTTLDDNIDSNSHFLGLEFYGGTPIIESEGFAWKVGGEIFGSLYYLTSDAIEHLGQVKYGAGIFTVVDQQLPVGEISVALDYKISDFYLPSGLSDTDNIFVDKGIEYVNELDTVHTISYGVNYGVPLMGDSLALNVEALRSHFESDDIEDDQDTRTTATVAASYYPTESFELTLGVNKVFEVDDYEDLGFTLGSIFRF
jgi:hypothetical protein